MNLEAIAIFSCGTFFGAALYISVAQHPATLETGVEFGLRFFPKMYKKAAPLQIFLALSGFVAGIVAWYQTGIIFWLIGSLLLVSVIPITLVLIKPLNDLLLSNKSSIDLPRATDALKRWGSIHWLRTIVSGFSFFIYLIAALGA